MDRCHLQDIEWGIAEVGSNRLLGFCAALGVSLDMLAEGRPLQVQDWKRMMAEEATV